MRLGFARLVSRDSSRKFSTSRQLAVDLYADLAQRGLLKDSTVPLNEMPRKGGVYIGFDPTADSLHIGNLLQVSLLDRLGRGGLSPIAIIGGATGQIGDPSGRSSERVLLSTDTTAHNAERLSSLIQKIVKSPLRVRNNLDWYRDMGALNFLRDVGKHFRLTQMLAKDSIKSRLDVEQGEGMSFTEFSYQLLQGYDFWYLLEHEDCVLQCGGSDQWGNITAGLEYIKRRSKKAAYGFTVPLLTDSEGNKIGKSTAVDGVTVWLSKEKTSPYDFYQHWINLPDADLSKLFHAFSFQPISRISEILAEHSKDSEKRSGQKELARELTDYVHGAQGLAQARAASKVFFEDDRSTISREDYLNAFRNTDRLISLKREEVLGKPLAEIAVAAKAVATKSAFAKLVGGGGFYLNEVRVSDWKAAVTESELSQSLLVLRCGKKDFRIVEVK